jgi:hypothetical protein
MHTEKRASGKLSEERKLNNRMELISYINAFDERNTQRVEKKLLVDGIFLNCN